jgi:hypothetical protein
MATRTSADLVTKILEKLFVVPEGQAPEVEDTARVELNLPSVLAELAAREIVYVTDPQNIPDAWFLSVAKICAYEMRDEFGLTGEALAACKLASDEGISNLKTMLRGRPTYETLKTLSF